MWNFDYLLVKVDMTRYWLRFSNWRAILASPCCFYFCHPSNQSPSPHCFLCNMSRIQSSLLPSSVSCMLSSPVIVCLPIVWKTFPPLLGFATYDWSFKNSDLIVSLACLSPLVSPQPKAFDTFLPLLDYPGSPFFLSASSSTTLSCSCNSCFLWYCDCSYWFCQLVFYTCSEDSLLL